MLFPSYAPLFQVHTTPYAPLFQIHTTSYAPLFQVHTTSYDSNIAGHAPLQYPLYNPHDSPTN
jgi:hypothetical protein